jgi:hypothetical protein
MKSRNDFVDRRPSFDRSARQRMLDPVDLIDGIQRHKPTPRFDPTTVNEKVNDETWSTANAQPSVSAALLVTFDPVKTTETPELAWMNQVSK